MAIQQIPSEVLEHIFRFLDCQSFCFAKQVCKSWFEIVTQMQTKKSLWKQFCIKEIPRDMLEEILSFKKVPLNETIIDWQGLYKKWFQGRMIKTSPYWKKLIEAFCSNPVTCVRLSGVWVITAHSDGSLCIWGQHNGLLHQRNVCHLKMISDMALVDLLNLGSYYGSENYHWSHHHVITVSRDRLIQIRSLLEPIGSSDSYIILNYHGDDLNTVKVFGDSFAVSCRDNTVSVWNMKALKKPHLHLKISLLHKIIGPSDFILGFGFWHDTVQCISYAGKLKVFSPTDGWIELKHFKHSYSENNFRSIISVTDAFLFHRNIVILLTADGKMVVSINDRCSRHYHLMKTLQTSLISVCFQGTILALGGENGKLFLFYISKDEELMNLDLSKPTLTLKVSVASIIYIDILFDNDSPVIVAATTGNMNIFKWYKAASSHQYLKNAILTDLFQFSSIINK